jgi:hypothetical protein
MAELQLLSSTAAKRKYFRAYGCSGMFDIALWKGSLFDSRKVWARGSSKATIGYLDKLSKHIEVAIYITDLDY